MLRPTSTLWKIPTTKTRLPFFVQNLILTLTGCYRLGNIDASDSAEGQSARGDRISARYDSSGMRKSIYLLAILGLFAACEQKTTTVNPPAEKKESNTTIVNPPSEKKETNTTVVNPPGSSTTTKEEKTDINVNTSPNP